VRPRFLNRNTTLQFICCHAGLLFALSWSVLSAATLGLTSGLNAATLRHATGTSFGTLYSNSYMSFGPRSNALRAMVGLTVSRHRVAPDDSLDVSVPGPMIVQTIISLLYQVLRYMSAQNIAAAPAAACAQHLPVGHAGHSPGQISCHSLELFSCKTRRLTSSLRRQNCLHCQTFGEQANCQM
jgi:hypothetical protein